MRIKAFFLHLLVLTVITGSIVLGYHHTFSVPFVFDDVHAIEENQKIRDPGNFLTLDSLTAQRPLVDLTFALNYHFGELEVYGYHLLNLIIHVVSAFLVYFLALLIFRRLDSSDGSLNSGLYRTIIPAAFVSLIFALHPVQTQAVTYIIQRYTSMAAMFYLAAVLCYILGRQFMLSPVMVRPWIPFRSLVLFILCFVFGLASFLSKQIALSLPLAILLVEYTLFDRTWAGWKKKMAYMAPLGALFFLFALYSAGVLQGEISMGRLLEETDERTRETLEVSRLQYLLTQFQVVTIYLGLLIWPVNLSLDYMYPFVDRLFQGWTMWGLLLLLILAATGIILRRALPAVCLGIFWFYIALSVESSLIPISDALFEHRLYLPMFGFALVLGWVFWEIFRRWQPPALVLGLFVLIFLAAVTYQRNTVWQDPVALWSDTVINRPDNFRAHNNLGQALEDQDRIRKAAWHYQKALEIRPEFAPAHLNLGLVLARAGRI
ncbi:tetratricopeptide repeat protein, partial [Desulfonatronospira sp.]|uniref:tetratricopeptide repeat protein n=1 Tax=Desulfonatronospira sp. TaxID=1962951 RepID=UPI0025BE1F42